MNNRLIGVVIFAIVIAASATLVVYRLVASKLSAGVPAPMARVVVASRNLAVGTLIKDGDVRLAEWSGAPPQQSALRKEDIVDRGVVENIYAGEPVLQNRLAAKGAGAGLSATIPIGMRAAAVRVNEVVGVAGFVTPGQRVDVLILGSRSGPGREAGTVSKTLLQNIEVLSAGQQIQKDAEGKPVSVQVVNLLVTPGQAEVLSLASNDARIQLVLRNPLDTNEAKTSGAALAELLGGPKAPVPAEAPPPRPARSRPAVPISPQPAPAPEPAPAPAPLMVIQVIQGGKSGAKVSESRFQVRAEGK